MLQKALNRIIEKMKNAMTYKGCRSLRVSFIIDYIGKVRLYISGKGYFLSGHHEKGFHFQNGKHNV